MVFGMVFNGNRSGHEHRWTILWTLSGTTETDVWNTGLNQLVVPAPFRAPYEVME